MSNSDLQREFLYSSIQDTVSTLRAIDTKLHIVLGIFLIPLAVVDKLIAAVHYWCTLWNWKVFCGMLQGTTSVVAVVTMVAWGVGVWISLRGIIALGNPIDAVTVDGNTPKGSFYFVGKLKGWFRPKLKEHSLEVHMSTLPDGDSATIRELAYEQMKLGFIRDVKMRRHRISAFIAVGWGTLAVVAAIMYHIAIWR